jgi:flagellar biogenesis protein FliO
MGSQSLPSGTLSLMNFFRAGFGWLHRIANAKIWRRNARRLRVSETISMGNRGYLAVIQFEQQRFLVGGTTNSIALLAQLPARCQAGESPDAEQDVQG